MEIKMYPPHEEILEVLLKLKKIVRQDYNIKWWESLPFFSMRFQHICHACGYIAFKNKQLLAASEFVGNQVMDYLREFSAGGALTFEGLACSAGAQSSMGVQLRHQWLDKMIVQYSAKNLCV